MNRETTVGLLTGLIPILLCLREQGSLRGSREMWEWLVGATVKTHTAFIKFTILYGDDL